MFSGDATLKVIGKMLDGCAARHKAIAANLANAETPGYKRLEVRFEEQLAKALDSSSTAELDAVQPQTVSGTGAARPDGNNVDFGTELGDLTKNTLVFSTFADLAAARVRQYREAIGE
ncbi:MAG TPA: flagellar basal body rod protein FlgB [Planctomycetota bacterium]|nr:flagellar basal body rod protein FlgB [Planctomycetota bacterium]